MKNKNCRIAASLVFFFTVNILLSGQRKLSEPFERELNLRQPPERVLDAIGVKPGMTIGEIGAGRGRYTVYLAEKTGTAGKVYANDIDETSLSYLWGRCTRLGIDNVETITGNMDDPLFPEKSIDMAVMVLVYHMIESPDNLLKNLKKSLKPEATLVIIDPRDELIDREFGIDRTKNAGNPPTIKERIEKSSESAGYELIKTETFLPQDYIFILTPVFSTPGKSAYDIIKKSISENGTEKALMEFDKIKRDSVQYDISEKTFLNLGSEFLGLRSYKEAVAVFDMGLELYPESTRLFGSIGEVYLLSGEKEKARKYYRLFIEHGPDSLNADAVMQNFDPMYEQMRQQIDAETP